MRLYQISVPALNCEQLRTEFGLGHPVDFNNYGRHRENYDYVPPDARRLIAGTELREALLSAAAPPTGNVSQFIVIGADIVGCLDLKFAKIDSPIRLEDCFFYDGIDLTEAVLRSVSLHGSSSLGPIDARHLRVTGDLVLDKLRVRGPLTLSGAHLEDDLHLENTTISPPDLESGGPGTPPPAQARDGTPHTADKDPLLNLDCMEVKGNVLAERLRVEGMSTMQGAAVGGAVTLDDARIGSSPQEVAWRANGLRVKGDLTAERMHARGRVGLIDAQVKILALTGACVESSGREPALTMDRLQCEGSLYCGGKQEDQVDFTGGIKAIGIKVGACLYLGPGKISAPDAEPVWAINLRRARIGDDIECFNRLQVRGRFDISNAQIGGSVKLGAAALEPIGGKTLAFDGGRAQIGGNLECDDDHTFTCTGTMAMMNARIDGWVRIENPVNADVELLARGLRVGGNATIQTGGTIDLASAQLAKDLLVYLDDLHAPDGKAAADLSSLTARTLDLHGRPKGCLELASASVHQLTDEPERWCPGRPVALWVPEWVIERSPRLRGRRDAQRDVAQESPIVLDGLVYEGVTADRDANRNDTEKKPTEMDSRMAWLEAGTTRMACRDDTPGFILQPYRKFAAVCRQSGRDSDARKILHVMYCRQNSIMNTIVRKNRHGHRHPILRTWNAAQNITIGYGYRPVRAIVWIILFSAAVTFWIIKFDNNAGIGVVSAAILSLGLALPGSGLDKLERVQEMSTTGHVFALILVLIGLVLGATVLTAIGRIIKN